MELLTLDGIRRQRQEYEEDVAVGEVRKRPDFAMAVALRCSSVLRISRMGAARDLAELKAVSSSPEGAPSRRIGRRTPAVALGSRSSAGDGAARRREVEAGARAHGRPGCSPFIGARGVAFACTACIPRRCGSNAQQPCCSRPGPRWAFEGWRLGR
jgi:hypothetical protein